MKFIFLGIVALFGTAGCTVTTEDGSETVIPFVGGDDDLYLRAEEPEVHFYIPHHHNHKATLAQRQRHKS